MRRHITWTICSCAFIIWAGTQSWAYQGDEAKPVGLTGLIAAYAPDGLEAEDFAALEESIDETWKSWVNETGLAVKDFYEGDNNTIEAQRAALGKLRTKLRTMEKALKDSRYQSIHAEIGDLYLRLAPEVDIAEALLETLTADKEAALRTRVSAARSNLNSAVSAFRSDMNRTRGGQAWLGWAETSALTNLDPSNAEAVAAVNAVKAKMEKRETYGDEIKTFMSRESFLNLEDALAEVQNALAPPSPDAEAQLRDSMIALLDAIAEYNSDPSAELEAELRNQYNAIRKASPDGGNAIESAFRKNYLNYNLRIAISEGLLNRVAGGIRRQTSRINDNALGARIVGNQTSDVTVRVDIQPSQNNARFNIQSSGVISTSSLAYASQATIQSVGRHSFSAVKPVYFDGTTFRTEPARVSVQANNQPVGASTRYSGRLFGNIAERIAMREANDRRGEANAYTQRSIRQQVSNELNSETNTRFSNASMELQNRLYGPLREYGLYPDAMSYSSTSNEILVRTRLSAETELGGGATLPGINPPRNGLVAQIHESLLTNSSNRLDLGTEGKQKMTNGELQALIEERLSRILDREVSLGDDENEAMDDGNTFVFDQPNPIRFQIANGEVTLILRAGLEREGDDIPTQIITVPLVPTMSEGKVLLNRGNVGVKPVSKPSSVAEQVARANVMRQKIQKALPEKELKSTFTFEQDGKKIDLSITGIHADNGWLTIELN